MSISSISVGFGSLGLPNVQPPVVPTSAVALSLRTPEPQAATAVTPADSQSGSNETKDETSGGRPGNNATRGRSVDIRA